MGKLLSLMTTWRFALKIATKFNATLTRANLKLVPFISYRMTTWFQVKPISAILLLVSKKLQNGANPLRLVTSQIPLEIWDKRLKSFKNQAFTWQPLGVVWSRLDLTTKFSKMSSLLPSFQKCTGRVRMVVVSLGFSLPTGIVMGMKFQLIKTRPWPSGNKNWQTCVTMLRPTNGWWWTAVTTSLYRKIWAKPFVWQMNSSQMWPLFIVLLMNMFKPWKVLYQSNYQRLQVSWLVRKQTAGTHLPTLLHPAFTSNKPSKKIATS